MPMMRISTHARTSQRSGLLSGYVGGTFTVAILDTHLVNVGSASVRQY
jgi:hypothetical protein